MSHILFVGHSHIKSLQNAVDTMPELPGEASFLFVRSEEFKKPGPPEPPHKPENIDAARFGEAFASLVRGVDAVVMCFNGNEHNNVGMLQRRGAPADAKEVIARVKGAAIDRTPAWHAFLAKLAPAGMRFFMLPSPPPIEDNEYLWRSRSEHMNMEGLKVSPADHRLSYYQAQMEGFAEVSRRIGAPMLALPGSTRSAGGFLLEDCISHDPTHGNEIYGERVLMSVYEQVARALEGPGAERAPAAQADVPAPATAAPRTPSARPSHPYSDLPDARYWRQSVAEPAAEDIDPLPDARWKIGEDDKIATAGSCFAQHVSRRIRRSGFNFLQVEAGPQDPAEAAARGYEDFSARYGNVYTARQLLQLFDRSFGYFRPMDRIWTRKDGRFCDPFRPRIEPDGFESREALIRDTQSHLLAVRTLFRTLDVFVFTLGLTECWVSRLDGAAYPVAPGVAGGEYDARRHKFVNFGFNDVVSDLNAFIEKLKIVNPAARILLTVSPVPLAATYEPRHVLVSTVASKAVLRAAADQVTRDHAHVQYFPSYEIITGPQSRGRYFEDDLRTVTAAGVDSVMNIFMRSVTERPQREDGGDEELYARMEALGEVQCEEAMLARP